jgi:hypothetical protein
MASVRGLLNSHGPLSLTSPRTDTRGASVTLCVTHVGNNAAGIYATGGPGARDERLNNVSAS